MTRAVSSTIEVLIVDDNPIVRDALRGILAGDEGLRVAAEAANGREALGLARRLRPAITLLDYRMPIADGLSVIGALEQHSAVLVLTSDDDPRLIAAMLRQGARGYLVHGEFEPRDLLRAVHEVAGGRGWLSPIAASVAASLAREQTSRVLDQRGQDERGHDQRGQDQRGQDQRGQDQQGHAERPRPADTRAGLTEREQDVLNLLSRGLSNASIARQLWLTEKTVKNHLNHIFAKLGVRNRTEAVVRWTTAQSEPRQTAQSEPRQA